MTGRRLRKALAALAMLAATTSSADAHVGSPDVFLDGHAGPYRLLVTIRPPRAIPGVADVEILTTATDVREVHIVPLPLTGPGAQFAPVPDLAVRSRDDPSLFTGHLWMMSAGAWQVRVSVGGDGGRGTLSVPVPTLPQATLQMGGAFRVALLALMLLLCAGFVGIVSAIARETSLGPGQTAGPAARRRGRIAGGIAALGVVIVVALGNWWWTAEASNYERYVYKPLEATPSIAGDGRLTLAIRDPGWIGLRRVDDFVDDHDHVMHLFIVSPALDTLWHLHPDQVATGTFDQRLPDMPAGQYLLFADVVHATGISETVTGRLGTPTIHGASLTGDDSAWAASAGVAPSAAPGVNATEGLVSSLPDGARMVWLREAQPLTTKRLTLFRFRVEDEAGRPVTDLGLYMGMPGHAIFVRRDARVFAHVHPSGSAPMAAMEISQRSLESSGEAQPSTSVHAHHGDGLPATVSFPFGFPEPGDYRIFVQVRRGDRIETGAFDAHVE